MINNHETIYLLPGNPPAIRPYNLWIEDLKKFRPQAEIKTLEYFPKDNCSSDKEFMDALIEETIKQIDWSLDNIILISHSFGGFIGKNIIEQYPKKIKKLIMIFPYLGNTILRAKLVLSFAKLIEKSPKIYNLIKLNKNKVNPIFKGINLVSDNELDKTLLIAKHEDKFFQDDFTQINIKEKDNIHLIYNPKDIWSNVKTTSKLRNIISSQYTELDHDFIINEDQRKAMAKLIFSEK